MPKGSIFQRFPYFTRRRFWWLVIILVAIALYIPINQLQNGGVQLNLPVDSQIPLYPPAIVPYLLGTVIFIIFPILAALYVKPREFESYAVSILAATVISCLAYLIFPTFVTRPDVTSNDFFLQVIKLLYQTDRSYNAAPSGHTFYTLISCFYISRWLPKLKWLWWILAGLIILSTLFTRQHYVLDVVCGIALAFLAYGAGRFMQKKWNLRFAS
jgi:membrane-associated phospholipid phosphatase